MTQRENVNQNFAMDNLTHLLEAPTWSYSRLGLIAHYLLPSDSLPSELCTAVRIGLKIAILNTIARDEMAGENSFYHALYDSRDFFFVSASVWYMLTSLMCFYLVTNLVCALISCLVIVLSEDGRSLRNLWIIKITRSFNRNLLLGVVLVVWCLWIPPWQISFYDNLLTIPINDSINMACLILSVVITFYSIAILAFVGQTHQASLQVQPLFRISLLAFAYVEDILLVVLLKNLSGFIGLKKGILVPSLMWVACWHLSQAIWFIKKTFLLMQTVWIFWIAWSLASLFIDIPAETLARRAFIGATFIGFFAACLLIRVRSWYFLAQKEPIRPHFLNTVMNIIFFNWWQLNAMDSTLIRKSKDQHPLTEKSDELIIIMVFWLQRHHSKCAKLSCFCHQISDHKIQGLPLTTKNLVGMFVREMLEQGIRSKPDGVVLRFLHIELMIKAFSNRWVALTELQRMKSLLLSLRSQLLAFSIKYEIGCNWTTRTRLFLKNKSNKLEVLKFVEILINCTNYNQQASDMTTRFTNLMATVHSHNSTPDQLYQKIREFHISKQKYLNIYKQFKGRYLPKIHSVLMKICIPEKKLDRDQGLKGYDSPRSRSFLYDENSFCILVSLGISNAGIIYSASDNFKDLLGLEQLNVIDHNLGVLLAPSIAGIHQSAIERFIKTGEAHYQHHKNNLFFINSNNFMQLVRIYNKIFINHHTASPCILSVITPRKMLDDYLFCDQDGTVLSITFDFIKKTNWRFRNSKHNNRIACIIPQVKYILSKGLKNDFETEKRRLLNKVYQSALYLDFIKIKTTHHQSNDSNPSLDDAIRKVKPKSQTIARTLVLNSAGSWESISNEASISIEGPATIEVPSKKFRVTYSIEPMQVGPSRFYFIQIHKLKPFTIKGRMTSHHILVFIYRMVLLKLFFRRSIRR